MASASTAAITPSARSTENVVAGTRSDGSGNLAQAGIGIELNYYAFAYLDRNVLVGNPKPVSVLDNSRTTRERDELSQT